MRLSGGLFGFSYGLYVNLDKVEDVLLHHTLLEQAEIPANQPAFYIRFLEVFPAIPFKC